MKVSEEQLEAWAKQLSHQQNEIITYREVFEAIFLLYGDAQEIEWSGDTWDIRLDDSTYKLLEAFDFNAIKNPAITNLDDIRDIMMINEKVKIKAGGAVWYIYRYDADPFPSNPHAHNTDQNIKLDLSNGKCYRNKKCLKQLPNKALLQIREAAAKVYKGELPVLNLN